MPTADEIACRAERWNACAPAIRFFTREGATEFSYASLADLVSALSFPDGALSVLIGLLTPSEGHEMLVVDTPDGPMTCVSHYLALFLIDDSIKYSHTPPCARQAYLDAALNHLITKKCPGLSFEEGIAFLSEAHANSVERAMKRRLAN